MRIVTRSQSDCVPFVAVVTCSVPSGSDSVDACRSKRLEIVSGVAEADSLANGLGHSGDLSPRARTVRQADELIHSDRLMDR